jgi:hypothetical protein
MRPLKQQTLWLRAQAVGSSAGLQRERKGAQAQSGVREGTVQASQCGCQAVVPSQSPRRQPTSCLRKWESPEAHTKDGLSPCKLIVCCCLLAAQNKPGPFFQERRRSGARPVWKTIIHVLLALSVYARPASNSLPTPRPPQLLTPLLHCRPPSNPTHATAAPLLVRPLDTPL